MMFEARKPSTRWQRGSAAMAAWFLLPLAAHGQVTESAVITSVGLDPAFTTVDFSTSAPEGFDVFSAPLSGFPTEGSTFFVISSGSTSSAPLPNDSGSTTTALGGLNTSDGQDLVSISFVMTPPAGAQCLSFDFKFFSEEFPEFVGGSVNDTFLAEIPASTFTIVGSTVNAPNNVAFDASEDPISINTTGVLGMSLASAFDTTYDGATVTLTTNAPITTDEGGNVTVVFSIMDLGDSIYDSTVFLDNLRWGNESCEPITEVPTPTATPAATPTATPIVTPTATPTPPPPPPGVDPYGLVWVYHSAADDGTPGCGSEASPCGISGESGGTINLWIDGGNTPSASGEVDPRCKFGVDGGGGDELCGADILIEMTSGHFTGIEPEVDTLVCNPSCDCGEGICSVPESPETTSIRMNFRRGLAPPLAVRRPVATLTFNSSNAQAKVFANGVGAAGANLQLRPIANAVSACTGFEDPFSCCADSGKGKVDVVTGLIRWPCGPRLIVPTELPEPGQLWQLMGGLAGLGCLYRLRRRA